MKTESEQHVVEAIKYACLAYSCRRAALLDPVRRKALLICADRHSRHAEELLTRYAREN